MQVSFLVHSQKHAIDIPQFNFVIVVKEVLTRTACNLRSTATEALSGELFGEQQPAVHHGEIGRSASLLPAGSFDRA
ncbi:MAG TPA: hypothetical protein VG308_11300 [Stellaceae bacterium]|nr:hypothetical protein [Stellaceae bacterium]